ncbi:MAG: hypothetical protein ACI3W8_03425 [Oscillospiraceae bacterium]
MKKNLCKRLAALLLALALLGSLLLAAAPAASAADEDTIYIDTAGDFAELARRCTLDTWSQGKTVVLRADISLVDAELTSIPIFGGEFDGNGHTISGLKITQSAAPNGLFGVLQESGVVRNLQVSGSLAPAGSSGDVGGIVGENHGLITGCAFTGSVSGGSNVGGIAGVNAAAGRILECRAGGSVTGDKMTGGIAGCNLGVIGNCRNSAYVNTVSVDPALSPEDLKLDFSLDVSKLSSMDTSMAASDTGGIAGYSSGIVSDCVNNAPVGYPHIGYNVGGIAGRSCGYINACENHADVFGRKDVGGIAGQMEPYIAQNITESALAGLESQLDALDGLLTAALRDADAGVGAVTSRLNTIADYLDSAADAASSIRTSGVVTGTVSGSGEADSSGGVTVTPPQMEAEGGSETSGGAGAVITPIGGAAGGGASSSGSLQGGLTEGGAEGEHHTSASGGVSAAAQVSITTNLSALSSAISGMSGQMRLLNGELSGVSCTLAGDLRAIQRQIGEISDTAMELFQGDGEGDVLIDSSEAESELVTLGKASGCQNGGNVSGDINVGGIAGAMAMEYELDPEDDIASGLDGQQRRKLEVKAIIQECVNTGKVVAKRSYAGGVCGRMDLGLIAGAENYGGVSSENGDYVGGIAGLAASTVRHCFAKCTLSGGKYIGGIVGSGVAEDLTGGSSTVAGCCSMVAIGSYEAFAGAISGVNAGNFVENCFISDTLTGINGRSYTGRAEPISYAALLKLAGVSAAPETDPEDADATKDTETEEDAEAADTGTGEALAVPQAFLQLSLRFEADGETLKTVPFAYGASFDESVYPEIPAKDGYDACWDKTELNDLHFDTVVTAVYTPYVSALTNSETRAGGRPIFFMEGQFDDEDAAEAAALPNTPEDFDVFAGDWTDFLVKSFSGPTVSREVVEQWRISIPDDRQSVHTVRYLAPDGDPAHLDIYVKGADGWQKAETEVIGSYLAFPVEGAEAEIAAISTVGVWWVWLLAGTLLLLLLALIIRLIRKAARARKLASVRAPSGSGSAPSGAPQKKKKRWVTPLLVVLALLVGAAGAAACFLLPDLLDGAKAYDLLKAYAGQPELHMELTVDAEVDSRDAAFTAALDRTEVEGRRVTAISQEERTLYYCDGTVFLENGNAYRLSSSFPDYSLLLDQTLKLYRAVDMEERDGNYTLTAEGADAKAVLELLLPSAAGMLPDTNTLQVALLTAGEEVSELRFSASGVLADAGKTPFRVSAALRLKSDDQSRVQIPEAVRRALASGEYEAAEALSDDLLRLINAWQTLHGEELISAKLLLRADCGPVTLDDQLDFYRWNDGGLPISSIRKNGYALYFTDTAVCNENGEVVPAADAAGVEAAKLLDVAYQLCLNAQLDCSAAGETYTYTLSLDEDGMRAVACAIAPGAEELDLLFDSGSLQLVLREDRLQSLAVCCGGTVQVALSSAEAAFEARMEFTEDMDAAALPETVKETLEKQKGV